MATSTVQPVYRLAMAGEQAGFTLEQMIQILNAGVSVETLLNWIELPLGSSRLHLDAQLYPDILQLRSLD
jgi:hypothetical protein